MQEFLNNSVNGKENQNGGFIDIANFIKYDIFENKKLSFIENATNPTEIIECKESIFKKVINKIKRIFSKR